MHILLTGATSFIGSYLLKRLIKDGYQISVIVRDDRQLVKNRHITTYKINGDVNDMCSFIKQSNIDCTIHLANVFVKEHTTADIAPLITTNVLWSTQLLESCVQAKIQYFINTGSYYQHIGTTQYQPLNLYAATKEAFSVIAKCYQNITFSTLKLTDTFGSGDNRPKIWNLWLSLIKGELTTLNMTNGQQIIALHHVDNVIEAYMQLIQRIEQHKTLQQEYFMPSHERYSLKEIASLFEQVSGKKLNIKWGTYNDIASRIANPIMPTKDQLIPGFIPPLSLKDGIIKFNKGD